MPLRSPNIVEFDEFKSQVNQSIKELKENLSLLTKEHKDLRKMVEDHVNISDIHTKRYPM